MWLPSMRLVAILWVASSCGATQSQPSVGVNITPDELLRLVERAVTAQVQPLVEELSSRIVSLDSRLSGVDSRFNTLDSRLLELDRLDTRLDEMASRVETLMVRQETRDPDGDGVSSRLDSFSSRLGGLSSLVGVLGERLENQSSVLESQQSLVEQLAGGTDEQRPRCGENVTEVYPRDCSDLPAGTRSGVHLLKPGLDRSQPPVAAFCDLETAGGGWTVLQRRADIQPRQDFFLGWPAYREGFGELAAEFWWGLENMWRMTAARDRRYELRVELADFDGARRHAAYGQFRVASEADGYRLSVTNYTGDAGDSFKYHNGQMFTTRDKDQDKDSQNCAQNFKGAGWYKACYHNNLNGQYLSGQTTNNNGVNWNDWRGDKYSLKEAELKIRPVILR